MHAVAVAVAVVLIFGSIRVSVMHLSSEEDRAVPRRLKSMDKGAKNPPVYDLYTFTLMRCHGF